MFFGQREKQAAVHHVVALVEFDMQKMRVRFLLTPEAIKERMQELEHPQEFLGG
jgi:lipoate-protein ligase A